MGFRGTLICLVSIIVLGLIAVTLVAGFSNANTGYNSSYGYASISEGLDFAEYYCAISSESIKQEDREEMTRELFSIKYLFANVEFSSQSLQSLSFGASDKIAEYVTLKQEAISTSENDGSHLNRQRAESAADEVSESLQILFRQQIIDDFEKVWFQNTSESFQILFHQQNQTNNEFFDKSDFTLKPEDKKRLINLSLENNCKWSYLYVAPTNYWELVRSLFVASLSSTLSDYWQISDIQKNFDNWRGSYVLLFENSTANPNNEDFWYDSNTVPSRYLITVPISYGRGSRFIQSAFGIVLIGWSLLVFCVGAAAVGFALNPLRLLEVSAKEAGKIIRTGKDVSTKLSNVVSEDLDKISAGRELQTLLVTLSDLLDEREQWMGKFFHQIKNDVSAMVMGIGNIEGEVDSPSSSFKNINKAASGIRNALNSLSTYQWILFEINDELTVKIDLTTMLETIANEIEDAGGCVRFEPISNLYVVGQATHLRSALQNLVWNAHIHGGVVKIEAAQIHSGKRVKIIISDNGLGIPDDEIEEMFKPYRHKNESSGLRGAGLGLSIARLAIENHGGNISISNQRNDEGLTIGLRVQVVLPVNSTLALSKNSPED